MTRYALLFVASYFASAQTGSSPAGRWVSNLKYFENNNYDRLELKVSETKLTGKLGNDQFDGTFRNGRIEGTVNGGSGRTMSFGGVLKGDRIEGAATLVGEKLELKWEAYREPQEARVRPKRTHLNPPSLNTIFRTQFRRRFM